MFWPQVHANKILKERGSKLVVETAITPSGPIHVGNLREILTGDFVVKSIGKRATVEFFYMADDFDPLRKVYPFLDQSFEQHVGKPLFLIPCPCGDHSSYADHFLAPFFEALKTLGVTVKIRRASQMYWSGEYTEAITRVIEGRDKIKKILEQESGREVGGDWFPFNPLCSSCQKLRAKVTDFDLAKTIVEYSCPDCSSVGVSNFAKGEGKLPWRIDWAARWWMLGVNVEGFGKDHASPGGSYETGERIAKEIFDFPAPYPIVYERVHLRGVGAMHSSTGVAIAASEILKAVSPTVIRYFFARSQPDRHIQFDPGEGIVQLYDEYATLKTIDPVFKMSAVETLPAVPYRHLVMSYQAALGKLSEVFKYLERTGYSVESKKVVEQLLEKIAVWLERYAPERYKFSLQQGLPSQVKQLSSEQKQFLAKILKLYESQTSWLGEDLHAEIHRIRKELGIDPKQAFAAIYLAFLGKDSGPQVGWFLAAMDRNFVFERLKQISS